VQEFTQNKCQRIIFDQCSPNGILLFRETSTILCTYGSRILAIPVRESIYAEKYKGIRVMLNTLVGALSGDYVNFGVFRLYNDQVTLFSGHVPVLLIVYKCVLCVLCMATGTSECVGYIPATMFANPIYGHYDVPETVQGILRVPRSVVPQSFGCVGGTGLSCVLAADPVHSRGAPIIWYVAFVGTRFISGRLRYRCACACVCVADPTVSSYCANCIDHLATYIFLHQHKEKPKQTVLLIINHLSTEPAILDELMASLFNAFLFATNANHWAFTRPMLPLLLASENSYAMYQTQLIATQDTPEKQEKLSAEFQKLTADIQRSLDSINRDKFTQRLTMFRLSVRSFLTL
jgi:hypothetical protein